MPALRGRLIILIAAIIVAFTFYSFYPSDHFRQPHSPNDPYDHYEAGGIDSDHYDERVVPVFDSDRDRLGKVKGDGECDDEEGMCGPEREGVWQKGPGAGEGTGRVMDEEVRQVEQEPVRVDKGGYSGVDEEKVKGSGWMGVSDDVLGGGVIMPKLGNATAKAELGRAAWRVLHLMTLRYPEEPTPDDRTTLKSFFHLFSRLYPCGECAAEFQALLKEYPPQTSSRKSASMWLCSVHNMVNERLGKEEFDCLTLNETYDCGCGPDGEGEGGAQGSAGSDGAHSADSAAAAVAGKNHGGHLTSETERDDDASRDTTATRQSQQSYSASPSPSASAVEVDGESKMVAELGGDEWEALGDRE